MLGPFQRRTGRKNGWLPGGPPPGCADLPHRSTFLGKVPEDKVELRVPIVVLAVDLLTAFGQVMFQVPQIRRLLEEVSFCQRERESA
jgi:hypothetical protein